MAKLVSTGQITIVDVNDSRTVTAYLTATSTQQIYNKDNATQFTPAYSSGSPLILTAKVYVSGIGDVLSVASSSVLNAKFCLTQGGTAITTSSTDVDFVGVDGSAIAGNTPFIAVTSSTLSIGGNLRESTGQKTIFFECDYKDPITGLTSHVIAQVTLNTVKTGTNAVYITFRGNDVIEQSYGTAKSVTAISADLIRASGVDTDNLVYKWYVDSAANQVTTGYTGYATKFGMKTSVSPALPTATLSDLGVNLPTTSAGNTFNTLVVSELAVTNILIGKVEITDTVEGKTYTGFFTVTDVSDAYRINVLSSTGDKLPNGVGQTTLTPSVSYGSKVLDPLTDMSAWTFNWTMYDADGKRCGFVDSTKAPASISASTTVSGATFTVTIPATTLAANDIVKITQSDGITASFYEVASASTGTTATLRAVASANTWLVGSYSAPATANLFAGGTLYSCLGNRTTVSGGVTVDTNKSVYAITATTVFAANAGTVSVNTGTINTAIAEVIAGAVIKCVKTDGTVAYYECGGAATVSGTSPNYIQSIPIRTPVTNTWLNYTNFPAPSTTTEFNTGKLYFCTSTRDKGEIVIKGEEIDKKGVIAVDANRP